MTWHEQSWVELHSPYTGGAYATHLIIAGIVNPDHNYELWVNRSALAKRCHTSIETLRRQIEQMAEDGWLELLRLGGGRGNITLYRFIRKGDQNEPVYETETGSQLIPFSENDCLSLKKESKPIVGGASDVTDLCEYLSRRVGEYHGGPSRRPKIIPRWTKDMDLLLRLGPSGLATPQSIKPAIVHRAIAYIFDELAEPNGGGFCWANNIQSPGKLREKWFKLADEKKSREASSI